jgi:hypothetical protein
VSLPRVRQLQRQYQARPDYASPPGPMNRYRIEEHLAKAFSTTLGQLVGEIEICFSEDEFEALDVAVSKAQFLGTSFLVRASSPHEQRGWLQSLDRGAECR